LVAQISTGTLCTLAIEPAGYPYGSFVTVAFEKGNPIFLISALAEHTKNLEQDARASLLVAASAPRIRSPMVGSRCFVPARASRGTGAMPAPPSLPRIRTLRATRTFATLTDGREESTARAFGLIVSA
jgi:pyridoxamine 5'-phosphate oxidase-like protein